MSFDVPILMITDPLGPLGLFLLVARGREIRIYIQNLSFERVVLLVTSETFLLDSGIYASNDSDRTFVIFLNNHPCFSSCLFIFLFTSLYLIYISILL
jgi:hypothetical protein